MKQTVRLLTLACGLAAACLSMPATAQQLDHDPGLFYMMTNDGCAPIGFSEGQEWTIDFLCDDTLGTQYRHPARMLLQGGRYQDSLIFNIEQIDSLLMFQPEPVMRSDVYLIDEDKFPYVLSADSTFTVLTIDRRLADYYSVPEVGSKIVCNIERQPLPFGYLGIVSEMEYTTTTIILTCRGRWTDVSQFYEKYLHTSSASAINADTPEKVRRRQALRRSGRGARAMTAGEDSFDDISWDVNIDLPSSKTYDFEKKLGPIGLKGSITPSKFAMGLAAEMTAYIPDLPNGQKDPDDPKEREEAQKRRERKDITFRVGFKADANFSIGADITVGADLDKSKDIKIGKLGKIEFGGALHVGASAGVELSGSASMEMVCGWNLFRDEKHTCTSKGPSYNLTLSGEGKVGLDASASIGFVFGNQGEEEQGEEKQGGAKAKQGDVGLNLSGKVEASIDILSFEGKGKMDLLADYPHDKPEDLVETYNKVTEDYECSVKFMNLTITPSANGKYKFIDYEIPNPITGEPMIVINSELEFLNPDWKPFEAKAFYQDIPYIPAEKKSSLQMLESKGDSRRFWYKREIQLPNALRCTQNLWVWDVKNEWWAVQQEMGAWGGLFTQQTRSMEAYFNLRKGRSYIVIPTAGYTRPLHEPDYFADAIPEETVFVPYENYADMPEVKYEVVGKARIDQTLLEDYWDSRHNFDVGFQWAYANENFKPGENLVPIELKGQEEIEAVIPIPKSNTPCKYRIYTVVRDGIKIHTDYSNVIEFESAADPGQPVALDHGNVTETSVVMRGELSEALATLMNANSGYTLGFEYGFNGLYYRPQYTEPAGSADNFTHAQNYERVNRQYSITVRDLLPNQTYNYRAFVTKPDGSNKRIYSPNATTVQTLNPFDVTTSVSVPGFFSAQVNGLVTEWVMEHFKDPQFEMKVYFEYVEEASGIKQQTPAIDVTSPTVCYEIEGLNNDRSYTYTLVLETRGAKDPYRGNTERFTTKDAYDISTLDASDKKFNQARLNGKITSYLSDGLKDGTITGELTFIFSTNRREVERNEGGENLKRIAIDPQGKTSVSHLMTGLKFDQEYYYKIMFSGNDNNPHRKGELIYEEGAIRSFNLCNDLLKAPRSVKAWNCEDGSGLAFQVVINEEAAAALKQGFNPNLMIHYALDQIGLKQEEERSELVMTLRDIETGTYQDTIRQLDINKEYAFNALAVVNEQEITIYTGGQVTLPLVTVHTGEAEEGESIDMHGWLDSDLKPHLTQYHGLLNCAFVYHNCSDKEPVIYEQGAMLINYNSLEFQALEVYVPASGDEDEDELDYIYRARLTLPNGEEYYGEEKSFTVYYYDPGQIAGRKRQPGAAGDGLLRYFVPRHRNALGQWERGPVPAIVKQWRKAKLEFQQQHNVQK